MQLPSNPELRRFTRIQSQRAKAFQVHQLGWNEGEVSIEQDPDEILDTALCPVAFPLLRALTTDFTR